jgi:hypothetical protein
MNKLLLIPLVVLFACSTAKPTTVSVAEPRTDKEVCVKIAQLHAQQKQAHESAATIKDPTMQPGIQRMMDGLDATVAKADERVASQGIRCN